MEGGEGTQIVNNLKYLKVYLECSVKWCFNPNGRDFRHAKASRLWK